MLICDSAGFSCAQAKPVGSKLHAKNRDKDLKRLMLLLQTARDPGQPISTSMIAPRMARCLAGLSLSSYDAYPHFKAIHEGRSDHGKGATQLARCTAMILELSLVGFLSPLARKFDIYP